MPRSCTICAHSERTSIDRDLARGVAYRVIARQYDANHDAVRRHADNHLPVLLSKAHEAKETAQADDLLGQLQSLQATTLALLTKAEHAGELGVAVAAVGAARRNIELFGRLTQQLDERPINIIVSAEWLTVRAALFAALTDFPEARVRVAERLVALEAGA